MADIPRSTFIPREGNMMPSRVKRRKTFHIVGFVSSALLFGSLLSAGFAYFLHTGAMKSLSDAQTALDQQKDSFKPENISEVREFDRKLEAAEVLLRSHISPLKLLSALERETKVRVQFTNFLLNVGEDGKVKVSLTGVTPEFRILALQERGFENDPLLKHIQFKEVSTTEAGGNGAFPGQRLVTFTLDGTIDPALIRYDGQAGQAVTARYFEDPLTLGITSSPFVEGIGEDTVKDHTEATALVPESLDTL